MKLSEFEDMIRRKYPSDLREEIIQRHYVLKARDSEIQELMDEVMKDKFPIGFDKLPEKHRFTTLILPFLGKIELERIEENKIEICLK